MKRLSVTMLLLIVAAAVCATTGVAGRGGEPPSSQTGCQLGTKLFGHGASVPRQDPCERCLCFGGQVLCWQERCPNQTRPGCKERRVPGICCPALECKDALAAAAGAVSPLPPVAEPSRADPLPPVLLPAAGGHVVVQQRQGCVLGGQRFELGELVPRASGPCMQCRCADGPRLLCRATPCEGPVMLPPSPQKPPLPPPTHTVRRITPTTLLHY
ncbi:kielin/chordin-like protein [Haemaphysalis longicornis]